MCRRLSLPTIEIAGSRCLSAPDAIAQVKRGLKNVFQRKNRREGEGESDTVTIVSPQGPSSPPVEAPSAGTLPSKSPKLTTPIPGSHIGTEGIAPGEEEAPSGTSEPTTATQSTSKPPYAEGMSATSGGPIGSTFEEAEEFERMMERRSPGRLSASMSATAGDVGGERASQEEAAAAAAAIDEEADDMLDAEARAEAGEGGGVALTQEMIDEQDAGLKRDAGERPGGAPGATQEGHEHQPGEGGDVGKLSKAEEEV